MGKHEDEEARRRQGDGHMGDLRKDTKWTDPSKAKGKHEPKPQDKGKGDKGTQK